MKCLRPTLQLLVAFWRQCQLRYLRWAERELCASHHDMPELVLAIRRLEDKLASQQAST